MKNQLGFIKIRKRNDGIAQWAWTYTQVGSNDGRRFSNIDVSVCKLYGTGF